MYLFLSGFFHQHVRSRRHFVWLTAYFLPCTPVSGTVTIQYINAGRVTDFSEDLLCLRPWARPRRRYSQGSHIPTAGADSNKDTAALNTGLLSSCKSLPFHPEVKRGAGMLCFIWGSGSWSQESALWLPTPYTAKMLFQSYIHSLESLFSTFFCLLTSKTGRQEVKR